MKITPNKSGRQYKPRKRVLVPGKVVEAEARAREQEEKEKAQMKALRNKSPSLRSLKAKAAKIEELIIVERGDYAWCEKLKVAVQSHAGSPAAFLAHHLIQGDVSPFRKVAVAKENGLWIKYASLADLFRTKPPVMEATDCFKSVPFAVAQNGGS